MRRLSRMPVLVLLGIILLSTPLYAIEKVKIDYPNTPIIYNTTMTLANTEYSQALPAGCSKFTAQCRSSYSVKLSFVSGESGTTYYTIKEDTWYWEDEIEGTRRILYFQCATAGQFFEIIAWYD